MYLLKKKIVKLTKKRLVPNRLKRAAPTVSTVSTLSIVSKGGKKLKNKKLILIIFLIVLLIFVFLLKDNILKIMYQKQYQEVVSIYQEKYKVEENLIFAVIKAESNFDNDAISHRSAIGLMQLMEETAKDVARKNAIELNAENGKEALTDVYKNIEIGTCYLATLLQRYGNKEVALAAYNAGIGTVDRLD